MVKPAASSPEQAVSSWINKYWGHAKANPEVIADIVLALGKKEGIAETVREN